jgi:hypothetical protein
LILPIHPGKCTFKSLIPDDGNIWHVQAGVDAVVRITRGAKNV